LDDVEVAKIKRVENDFHKYLDTQAKNVIELIGEKKDLTDDVVEALRRRLKSIRKPTR
jgi:F0F1-type ATP synthase alpha subunit